MLALACVRILTIFSLHEIDDGSRLLKLNGETNTGCLKTKADSYSLSIDPVNCGDLDMC